jgi:hypothetical protein
MQSTHPLEVAVDSKNVTRNLAVPNGMSTRVYVCMLMHDVTECFVYE